MSLKEHQKKRDFRSTDEPKGKAKGRSGNMFVVQKHAASRLHYDFRLELNGVLVSWAVPKGPSLNPADKRLAVHVEDHPVEYGSFEGTIPKDQYGGGTVMLWDRGEWEPKGDASRGLEKGKLSFVLKGEKLQGEWTLARIKTAEDKDNWLLIKAKDDAANSKKSYDILKDKPLSVASGRSIEKVSQENSKKNTSTKKSGKKNRASFSPNVASLPNAKKTTMPKTYKPQLATLVQSAPQENEWVHEIKFDGYRILAFVENASVRLQTRNGKNWTKKFSRVADSLKNMPIKTAILDGEIVLVKEDGTTDFQALQNVLKGNDSGTMVYYLFDLPYCSGYDLSSTPLLERKKKLRSLVQELGSSTIRYSDHMTGKGPDMYQHACRYALEGIISKHTKSSYQQKRSRSWVKVKCLKRQEFVIGGYTEPSGSRKGIGALLIGYYDNNELMYAGKVDTGFNSSTLKKLHKRLQAKERKTAPFSNPPSGSEARNVHWVTPSSIAEIEFSQWTRDNRLRQPVFHGLREDTEPKNVIREKPIDPPSSTGVHKLKEANMTTIQGVRLSNPDKVLFPDQGVSKKEIADYYVMVADHILPFIVDRPLSLLRCPDGRKKQCFFQKHISDSMPEAIDFIKIKEKKGTEKYILIHDTTGLLSLVQMGVLEIHPWGSSSKNVEKPDILTFDLDPDEGVDWKHVVKAAKLIHDRLEDLGLQSFVKTSGGKGLHVVIPISRRSDWEEVKTFTGALAKDIAKNDPDHFVATMSKEKRKNKIFIDYLRNSRGATSVAPYSTRAKLGATVSAPVRWNELSASLKPDKYHLKNMNRRLSSQKKDPWEGFFNVRQSITSKMKKELGIQVLKIELIT